MLCNIRFDSGCTSVQAIGYVGYSFASCCVGELRGVFDAMPLTKKMENLLCFSRHQFGPIS